MSDPQPTPNPDASIEDKILAAKDAPKIPVPSDAAGFQDWLRAKTDALAEEAVRLTEKYALNREAGAVMGSRNIIHSCVPIAESW